MTLAVRNLVIQDNDGNLMAGASIEVRRDVQGKPLAQIYSDRAGLVPLANPFVTDDGKASFFAFGGAYQITATREAFEDVQNYVAIGRGSETDLSVVTPRGLYSAATSLRRWRSRYPYGCRYRSENLHLVGGRQPQPHAAVRFSDPSIPRFGCSRRGISIETAQAILDGATTQAACVATAQAGIATGQQVIATAKALEAAASAAASASASVSPALRYIFDTGTSAGRPPHDGIPRQ